MNGQLKTVDVRTGERLARRTQLIEGIQFGCYTIVGVREHIVRQRARKVVTVRCKCGYERSCTDLYLYKTVRPDESDCRGRHRFGRLDNGLQALHALYCEYRANARRKAKISGQGIEFSLQEELFRNLVTLPCVYCGSDSASKRLQPSGDEIRFTGIDRIDNSKPYDADNVVPCCKTCNRAKSDLSVSQFLKWIGDVYVHMARPDDALYPQGLEQVLELWTPPWRQTSTLE
jgi:hypothetical protein